MKKTTQTKNLPKIIKNIFFVIMILFFPNLTKANDGFVSEGGVGNTVKLLNNEEIQMVDEILDITITKENKVKVEIYYTFKNTTSTEQNVKMGFPEKCITFEENKQSLYQYNCKLHDLEIFSNNQKLNLTFKTGETAVTDGINWYMHEIDFQSNEEKKVNINYWMDLSFQGGIGQQSVAWFEYILSTGASWKGNIEKIDITIKVENNWNAYNLAQINPLDFEFNISENTIKWHFENIEPAKKDNIKIKAITEKHIYGEGGNIPLEYSSLEFLAKYSSSSLQEGNMIDYAHFAFDNKKETAWMEGVKGSGIGQWIIIPTIGDINYPKKKIIKIYKKIRLFNGFGKDQDWWQKNNRIKKAKITFPNKKSQIVEFADFYGFQEIDLSEEIIMQWEKLSDFIEVKLEILEVYKGSEYDDTCLSEIEFLGVIDGGKYIEEEKKINDYIFKDISNKHPNYQAIKYVKEKNIVNGYKDGTFRPNNKINRAEFVKIIIEATQPEWKIASNYALDCFSDISNEWFTNYVCYSKSREIIGGYPDGTFKPNKNISFAEASKIIVNAFGYEIEKDQEVWYRPYTQILSDKNVIPDSIIDIKTKITRRDMAEIIWRLKKNVINQPYRTFTTSNCLCIPAGHIYGFYPDTKCEFKCCHGSISRLYSKRLEDGLCLSSEGAVCLPCGNGICEQDMHENDCNCPEDCTQ